MARHFDSIGAMVRAGSDPSSGVYLQAAADDASIRRMQAAAQRSLDEMVPEQYVALLRVSDGAQVNCAYFKAAAHLVPDNLDASRPEIIILGADGTAEFVFDRRDRQFHTINMGYENERFASFGSFAEMLTTVLREQQVL